MVKDNQTSQPEAWLRGAIPDIPDLLQPSAHALVQVREELMQYTKGFPENLLWEQPAGRASVGFHLQHLTGVLDRMLTYTKGKNLSEAQFNALYNEGNPSTKTTVFELVRLFDDKVTEALAFFKTISRTSLTEKRTVGRKKLPSTVIGLLFHAAEHSQRHLGQLLVTISVVKANTTTSKNKE